MIAAAAAALALSTCTWWTPPEHPARAWLFVGRHPAIRALVDQGTRPLAPEPPAPRPVDTWKSP